LKNRLLSLLLNHMSRDVSGSFLCQGLLSVVERLDLALADAAGHQAAAAAGPPTVQRALSGKHLARAPSSGSRGDGPDSPNPRPGPGNENRSENRRASLLPGRNRRASLVPARASTLPARRASVIGQTHVPPPLPPTVAVLPAAAAPHVVEVPDEAAFFPDLLVLLKARPAHPNLC